MSEKMFDYFKNIIMKFPKTSKEKDELRRLKSFLGHIEYVLALNKRNGIKNSALVISSAQVEKAKNRIQEIKTQIKKRRFNAFLNK